MNRAEALERMVEPLYLVVAGHEIDRLRFELRHAMEVDLDDLDPGCMIVAASGEDFSICYSPNRQEVERMVDDPGFSKTLNNMTDAALGSVAVSAIREYCLSSKGQIEEEEDVAPHPNIDICSMAVMKIHRNSGKSMVRPGHVPMFILAEYRQMDKTKKFVFSMLWRRCISG